MKNGKPREERDESVTVYPLRPMQILTMSVKAEAASETWLENVKRKMKKDEIAEIGIDPVTVVTRGIEIGIGRGIGIGVETGIGIGIVAIGEDHGPDHEIAMDIGDAISTALDHGIVPVVPAHAPKSDLRRGIGNDQEAVEKIVKIVVQRANDRQNRMPAPTMIGL